MEYKKIAKLFRALADEFEKFDGEAFSENMAAPETEKAEEKPASKKTSKKSEKKEDKVVDFEEKVAENNDVEAEVDKILDEYEEDSIIEELKNVGLKGVTKKTLRKKLAEAIKKDLLNFDDDEDEDEDDTDAEASDGSDDDDEGEEIDKNTYFEDFDDDAGANNPENVKPKRLKAMKKLQGEILDSIENEDLDVDAMKSFVLENSTEDEQAEVEKFDDDDVVAAYIELRKRMIDDDGDDMSGEDDPYEVNGEVYAHGHLCPLVDGEYIDEVSGDTFELE